MPADRKKRCLIVGFGSIGKRHARVISELCGQSFAVYSRRNVDFNTTFTCLKEAVKNFQPDYIVVANRTFEHIDTVSQLKKQDFKVTY